MIHCILHLDLLNWFKMVSTNGVIIFLISNPHVAVILISGVSVSCNLHCVTYNESVFDSTV